jgi:hypothetical protein
LHVLSATVDTEHPGSDIVGNFPELLDGLGARLADVDHGELLRVER